MVPVGNGWTTPANGARFGYDYLTRAATSKSNMYVNQPEETRYFFADVDGTGQRLNGNGLGAMLYGSKPGWLAHARAGMPDSQ